MQHACAGWQAAPAVVCMLTSRIDAANPGATASQEIDQQKRWRAEATCKQDTG
jgi:hypothetical protein